MSNQAQSAEPSWVAKHSTALLLTLGAAGVALILVAALNHKVNASEWREVCFSVGEALIVSSLLGLSIDPFLRRKFADEIAHDVFLTLFGIRAPTDYVLGLESLCRTDRLSHGAIWEVNLEWFDDQRLVKAEICVRNTIKVIGSTDWEPNDPWLISSAVGSPGSVWTLYEATIVAGDGTVSHVPRISNDRITGVSNDTGVGLILPVRDIVGSLTVPSGSEYQVTMVGELYFLAQGSIPLVHSSPALNTTFIVRGSALADLDVTLSDGASVLKPKSTSNDSELHFSKPTLSLTGATFRLQWVQKKDGGGSLPAVELASPIDEETVSA